MDLIDERFRPKYEAICVGNKPQNAQNVFFEGSTMQEGLGTYGLYSNPITRANATFNKPVQLITSNMQAPKRVGMAVHLGGILTIPANRFVYFLFI